MKNLAHLFLFTLTLFFGCKEEQKTISTTPELAKVDKLFKLTPFEASEDFPDAKLKNMTYVDGQVNFDVISESYKLGVQTPDAASKMCANSGEGQHIHLIIDNEPYAAKYTSSFEYDIPDGEHTVLAFLSRSYHESIKTNDANILTKILVKNKSISATYGTDARILTYSRPKGTYIGDDTKKVMLDFYLSNVSLGDGYTVDANINGESHEIDNWQPYYIEGLPMGENTIKLTLMKDGEPVFTPLNPVTRTFTLKRNPEPEN